MKQTTQKQKHSSVLSSKYNLAAENDKFDYNIAQR